MENMQVRRVPRVLPRLAPGVGGGAAARGSEGRPVISTDSVLLRGSGVQDLRMVKSSGLHPGLRDGAVGA
jgi:hypothetical protein